MLNDKNNSMNNGQDNRNLSDVFKELQEIRYSQTKQVNTSSKPKSESKTPKQFNIQKHSEPKQQSNPQANVSFF